MLRGITLVRWSRNSGQANPVKTGALWAGIIWSLACTVFICAALSLWVFMTSGQNYHFSGVITLGVFIGAFLGGAVSGWSAGSMGLLHGAVVGFVYSMGILLLYAVWSGFSLAAIMALAFNCLIIILLAALGGIVGVNLAVIRRERVKYRLYQR